MYGNNEASPARSIPAASNGGNMSSIRPHALCHVVIRTTPEHYDSMVDWYLRFTGGWVTHATPRITFLTYDHEHHRLAILVDPHAVAKPDDGGHYQVGVHHIAFGFTVLEDLAVSYEQKKTLGLLPVWCVNHGMSVSMYYEDIDGNRNELQVDSYDTAEAAIAFMESSEFAENPIGVDFDPDDFVNKLRSGVDPAEIKRRPNIGPRKTR